LLSLGLVMPETAAAGPAAGLLATINVGSDVVAEEFPLPTLDPAIIGRNSPIIPDDFWFQDAADARPTPTMAAGIRLTRKPPTAPHAANLGSDNSSNRRRRAALPSTTEKANPPKKAGYASAAGQMSTSAPSGFGQMLWIISMANPRKAPPMAQITASPGAPRMRRRHSFMGISCLPVK
jgi:hypothetical protein